MRLVTAAATVRGLGLALAVLAVWLTVPAQAADDQMQVGRVIQSPWLGLRFVQDGQEVEPLIYRELLTTEVHLARGPFRILLPMQSKSDVYRITAWSDASIFTAVRAEARAEDPNQLETPAYFRPGTGMADTDAGSGTLMLNNEGHHYLVGLRLGPDPNQHVFYVSQVLRRDATGNNVEKPIEDETGPLYLVAFFDKNGDSLIQHGEYEFLVLRFDGAGARR